MRKRLRLVMLLGAALSCLAWCPTEASAQGIEFNSCPGGNWSQIQAGCGWVFLNVPNPPVFRLPQDGDAAQIDAITGTFTLDVNSANLASLAIDAKPGTTGTFSQPGSTLTSGSETIGPFGTFSQTGGSNNVSGAFTLSARYDLHGPSASLSAGSEAIDQLVVSNNQKSAGFFNQVDGKNTVTGTLTLGANPFATNGRYDLSGGQLTANNEIIGDGATGTFNQSMGSNTAGTLILGNRPSGSGTYTLTNGTLQAVFEEIGFAGQGMFTQTGGTNTLSSSLSLGLSPNSGGTYDLSGNGVLSAQFDEDVGSSSGVGVFTQSGATTNTVDHFLRVSPGFNSGSPSEYHLKGGTLQATGEEISGLFGQTGGLNMVSGGGVTIESAGGYSLNAGALTVASGVGLLGIDNSGVFNFIGGNLTGNVTNENKATFFVGGGGTKVVNGDFTNDGLLERANGTNLIITGTFIDSSQVKTDPATTQFHILIVTSTGYLTATAGDVFDITGNFQNLSTQNTLWDTSSSLLDFTGGGTHTFDLAGQNGAGFANNFAWGTLVIDAGNILDLGTGSGDALYVDFLQGLDISGNLITNIDGAAGLFVYYNAADNPLLQGNYNLTGGGELIAANGPAPTPEPGTLLLLASGLGSLLARKRWRRNKS